METVLASGDLIRADPLYPAALLLVLAGRLHQERAVPVPLLAAARDGRANPGLRLPALATMVKAGVFLLARMYPALGGTELWFWTVAPVGLATLLVGAYVAIFQHDLKGLLAYSTISHLGLVTLLFGIDTRLAVVAGVFHILNHATFKASLFMAAASSTTRPARATCASSTAVEVHAGNRRARHGGGRRDGGACRCSTASCRRRCSLPRPSAATTAR